MPRSQGFARGDLDTAFPLDDKFLALRGRLDAERYYAAAGVYFTVVAATWREAERKVAIRVAPDAPDLIEHLVAVGLLGDDGRLPTRVFTSWVGRARRQRKSSAERQARNRAGKSREVTRDNGVTARESPPARASAPPGTEGTVETDTGGAGGDDDRDALDTYYELTLFRPWGQWSGEKLLVATRDYGNAAVEVALDAEFGVNSDRKTLLDRTLARLARDAERSKRNRPAKPRKAPVDQEKRNAVLRDLSVVRETA